MSEILNNDIHIEIKEIGREELAKAFEVLHERGLINQSELQMAITLANEKYKSVKHLEHKININLEDNNLK